MLGLVLLLLLILGIVLFVYASLPSRPTMRSRIDTTPPDLRRADDGRGDGNPEDPSTTWMFPTT